MFKKVKRIGKEIATAAFDACFNPPKGLVLMLHRIGPEESYRLNDIKDLIVTTRKLQEFIDRQRGKVDFISLDELYQRFLSPISRSRPFVCITLDDGFKDNLTFGLPFFERNCIPFSVFITTDFIEKHPPFNYPFLIENIIRENSVLFINGEKIVCNTLISKNNAFRHLKEIVLSLPYSSFEERFNQMFGDYLLPTHFEDITLTWDDIRHLASSSLCTIGSHTITHRRLSNMSTSILQHEIEDSKRIIENHIQREVRYITYPYGWTSDVNDHVVCAVQNAGYRLGFISWGGPIRKLDTDSFRIKRQMFTGF